MALAAPPPAIRCGSASLDPPTCSPAARRAGRAQTPLEVTIPARGPDAFATPGCCSDQTTGRSSRPAGPAVASKPPGAQPQWGGPHYPTSFDRAGPGCACRQRGSAAEPIARLTTPATAVGQRSPAGALQKFEAAQAEAESTLLRAEGARDLAAAALMRSYWATGAAARRIPAPSPRG